MALFPPHLSILNENKTMDILTVPFESPFTLIVRGQTIQIITFKTPEHGNIKFGIEAPRSVQINREEIHLAIQQQKEEI